MMIILKEKSSFLRIDMQKDVFQCEGPSGKIEFEIDGETIGIGESRENIWLIPSRALRRIEYRNHPWIFRNNMSFRLSVIWTNNGKDQRKDILLYHDRKANADLVRFLKSRYPEQCLIGPNKQEERSLLAGLGKKKYRLYTLGLATTLSIILAILIIEIIFLYLSITTSQFVSVSNVNVFYRTGEILFIIAFIILTLLMLIVMRRLMVVKTDQSGLIIQRLLVRNSLNWEDIVAGNAKMETSNVYTGLFCYYSDQVNVLTARNFIEIPLRKRTGEAVLIKMSMDEAGLFYRELYYRGKVSLEEAKEVRAFI
jgi:hypothetical protein